MHIVFLPSWYPAHSKDISGSFFREQAMMLAAAGCQVGVLAPQLLSPLAPLRALQGSGTRMEIDGAVPTWRGAAVNLAPRMPRLQAMRLAHLARKIYDVYVSRHGRPDLLHVHSALMAGAAALSLRDREGIPYVLSEHSSSFARGRVGVAGIALTRRISASAHSRYAVSAPFARKLEVVLGPEVGPWSVMPNPVSPEFLDYPLPVCSRQDYTFLHVSLLDQNKNVDSIVAAFARKFRGRADVSLRIGGDGPTRASLIAQAEALGVASQVCFPGRLNREQVREELAGCDAFVLSSRFETFGVVLIEALAMGKPIVATACGGPEDIVTPGNGFLVPPGDEAALGEAMAALMRDRYRFDATRLRADCRVRFGPQAVTRRWIGIYETALDSRFRFVAE